MFLARRDFLYLVALSGAGAGLPLLAGCGSTGWTTWQAVGLPRAHFFDNALVFFDSHTAFLGGSLDERERKACLFRSDDDGRSWRRLPLPESRLEVTHIAGHGQEIVVSLGITHKPSALLHSRDGGESWTQILGPEAGVSMPKSASLAMDASGLLRVAAFRLTPPNVPVLLLREPGGTWENTCMPERSRLSVCDHSSLFLPINADGYHTEAVYLEGGPSYPLPFPMALRTDRAPGADRSWWLCGWDWTNNRPGPLRVVHLTPEGCRPTDFILPHECLPSVFTGHGKTFCLSAITSASIFGASHVLYISRDSGATQRQTAPSFTLIMEPAFQYKDDFYIISQATGSFARLTFGVLDR